MNISVCDLSIVHESYLQPSKGDVIIANNIVKYEYELFLGSVFHFNFYGEISVSGYSSCFFYNNKIQKDTPVNEYAKILILELLEEYKKTSKSDKLEEIKLKTNRLKEAQLSLF